MSISAEHIILNKMKEATNNFIKILNTIKTTAVEIEQIAKNEIDNDNYYVENCLTYKKFNEIFDIDVINHLIDSVEPLLNEIDDEKQKVCENHEYIEDRVETGLECDMMTIYCCKFCRVIKK
jgi:hypothetical protein